MEDTKSYVVLTNGCYACSKSDWDSDSNKLAIRKDGTNFNDGLTLYIYTEGSYEGGCTYAFAKGGHWYTF